MANLFENLIIRLQAKPDESFNTTLKNAKKTIGELSGEITSLASTSAMALGGISAGIGLIVKSWLDAAGAMEQYEAKLTTVLKSATEAKVAIKEAVEFAAKTPFEVKDIVDATVQLEVYGQKTKEWLPLVGDLAAGMRKDLGYTSQVIGKALNGSADGFESLRNELAITTAKLVQYGAVMGETGGISLKTTADLEKAQQALQAIIKTEFGGAMERQANTWQGAMSNLNDSISKLQVLMGEALIPALTQGVRVLSGFIELVGSVPKEFTGLIAFGTLAAGAMGGLGAAMTGLITILPSLSGGFNLITQGLLGETLALKATEIGVKALDFASSNLAKNLLVAGKSLGIVAVGVAAGVIAFNAAKGAWKLLDDTSTKSSNNIVKALAQVGKALLYTSPIGVLAAEIAYWERYTEKMTAEIAKQEKALRASRMVTRQYASKTVDDLRRMGVTVKELEENMKDLAEGAKDAFQRGDTATGKFFVNQIRKIEQVKAALKELGEEYSNLSTAVEDLSTNFDMLGKAQVFKTAQDEAKYLGQELDEVYDKFNRLPRGQGDSRPLLSFDTQNIDQVKTGLQLIGKMIEENRKKQVGVSDDKVKAPLLAEEKYLKTMFDLTKKQYDALNKVNDDRLKASETFIQRKKDLNQMSLSDEIRANERMLTQVKGDSDKEAEIRHNIAVLRYKMAGEAKNKVEQALRDELDAVKDMTSGQIAEYDKLIKKIREYMSLKKIDTGDGKKLIKTAEKEKKTAQKNETKKADKDQKDEYDRVARVQKDALDKMGRAEEKGAYDRIRAINSYIRFWENEERKRPAFKKQIEDKLLELVRERENTETEIIQANREAEKDLRQMRTESLNYNISQLEEKLAAGEDVEAKLMEKIKERHKLELQNIREQVEEWRKKGVTQEKIEEKTALLKQQLHQKDLQQIEELIQKLKAKNDEEKQEEKKPGPIMTVAEAFGESKGFGNAAEEAKKRRERQEAIEALEAEKARIEAEKKQYDEKIRIKQQEYETAGTDEEKEVAKTQINQYEASKKALDSGMNSEQVFSSAADVFARAVDNFAKLLENGFPVNNSQYQAIRGSKDKSSSSSSSANINITINLKGQETATNQGITAKQDPQGNVKMSISRDVLATARGEVTPVGRTAFQSFLGGGSILGGVGEAFA